MITRKDIQEIDIYDILLDADNARYGESSAKSQKDAIDKLLSSEPNMLRKVMKLVEDVVEYGIDPTELLLVFPVKDHGKTRYIAAEGNRRVLAMRFLLNPDLAPSAAIKKRLEQLTSKQLQNSLQKVQCSVMPDRSSTDHWVQLKHTGENDGIGRVNWTSVASNAFQHKRGKERNQGLQILDYIKADDSFDPDLKEVAQNIGVTNLARFFQGKPAKDAFRYKKQDGKLKSNISLPKFRGFVETVVREMDPVTGFNVGQIYHRDDQVKFIKNRLPDSIRPSSADLVDEWTIATLNDGDLNKEQLGSDGKALKKKPARKRSASSRANRKFVIDDALRITDAKINELYLELRNHLDVDKVPNAVSMLTRAFIEANCNYYIDNNSVRSSSGHTLSTSDKNRKLKEKAQAVATHLEGLKKLTQSQARAIRAEANGPEASVDSMNMLVHSYLLQPKVRDLNRHMDNWMPLIRVIWS